MQQAGWKKNRDFVITLRREGNDAYRVHADGPTGEANHKFEFPIETEQLVELTSLAKQARQGGSQVTRPMPQTVAFGTSVFQAIFAGPVRDIYTTARHDASVNGYGLRLKLRLASVPELVDWPWEYLYDGRDFLALSGDTPIVRHIDLPNPSRSMTIGLPLRILITVSSPSSLPPLEIEREKERIQQALLPLTERGLVSIDFTADATLNAIQRQLRQGKSTGKPYHVWHFIGHGIFDADSNLGVLALTNERGDVHAVGGFQLGTLFKDYPEVRLALLNACEGARFDREDPFSGVATALVQQRIPAVIAMQFEISDAAAVSFATEFYASLVDNLPVDAAVTEARRAVFFMPNWVEWATPVLFMQVTDGRLFDVSRPRAIQKPGSDQPSAGQERAGAERLRAGLGLLAQARDRADDLFAQIRSGEVAGRTRAQYDEMMSQLRSEQPASLPEPAVEVSAPDVPEVIEEKESPLADSDPEAPVEDSPKTDALIAATSEDLWFDPAVLEYTPMPHLPTDDDAHLLKKPWRIVLEHYTADKQRIPFGYDLYGTMTLGRNTGEETEGHINLDAHDAHALGVSRRHMSLRGDADGLYLMDLGSTNGTTVNHMPAPRHANVPLKHRDVIALNRMTFLLHIISQPDTAT